MKKFLIPVATALFFCSVSHPQTPSPQPKPDRDDSVVRISTELIRLDVTVTDKKGKVVPDLRQDEFEIFENGEKQTISSSSFVFRATGSAASAGGTGSVSDVAVRRQPVTRAAIRRTVAIVVDDLNLSFLSVNHTRKALRKFVDEQMQPDDLVAIIRTGGGVGALQQFTSDKRLLYAAIEKLRWNPARGGFDSLSSVSQRDTDIAERFRRESDNVAGGKSKTQTVVLPGESAHDKKGADVSKNSESQEAGLYAQTTLGALTYVISGMSSLPGRKALFFFSDGIDIGNDAAKGRASSVFDYLQNVTDQANRSSVVVYTFDTKGMRSMSIGASDNTYEIIDGHRGQKEIARREDFRNSQDGLAYFADRTGGRAFLNSDNFNGGIQRALDEQEGYYLLAYVPDGDTFDAEKRRFNKLEIRVKREGLDVSYRSGFFSGGTSATSPGPTERTLASFLLSPFVENDIALNINALYADDKSDGPYIRSFLHIDARGLKFGDDSSGWKRSTFEVVAAAFGDNGLPLETKESQYTIKAKGATYAAMLERGFVYVLPVPLKKPGIYQFRVAVRDKETGKIGSAYQIVEVPDMSRNRLFLSSLAVENVSNDTWQIISSGKVGSGPGKMQIPSTLLYDTVLRRFHSGSILRYGCEVYIAAGNGGSVKELETHAAIYHDKELVLNGNLNKIDVSRRKDPGRFAVSGAITIPHSLQPGDYVLRLTVFDRSANRSATQILPFEIVK